MAFLFTAVSETMRNRVIEHNGLRVLYDIMVKTVYGDLTPHSTKIGCGKKRAVKQNSIVLSEEDINILPGELDRVANNILYRPEPSNYRTHCTYSTKA